MARPFFDQTEAFALSIVDALAGGRRPHPLPYLKQLEPSPQLIRIGAERLAIHLHRHLLRSGGDRERTVLRGGRRATGRLWDPALNEGFGLRFTAASINLWLGLVQGMLHPPKRRPDLGQRLGRCARVEGTESGDWLFYARALAHLPRLPIETGDPHSADDLLGRRLRSGSPLAVLWSLSPHLAERAATSNLLERLLGAGSVRIAECLDGALLPAWTEALSRALHQSPSLDPFVARAAGAALVLGGWLDALDRRERLDLAAGVMRFLAALPDLLGSPSIDRVRADLASRYLPRTVHERQRAEHALAGVLAVGVRLAELDDRFAALRYGDPRWDEGQLYRAAFADLLAPQLDRIRALERGLRGVIG